MNQFDEDLLPAPIIDDGLENPFINEGGDLWELANGGDVYGEYSAKFWKNL
jgi:hypothetical protein